MAILQSYRQYKEVIVVEDYTFSGGGARPIYTYYRYKINKGDKTVLLLRLALRRSYLKLFLLLFFKNRFVVNGIGAFWSWPIYFVCLIKKDLVIYLHEAGPHVEQFKRLNPTKHRLFQRILRERKVAFVSEWQQRYFEKNYSLGRTKVLYNAMSLPEIQKTDKVGIVMIAYQTRNKNVDFFSKVADSAAVRNLPYQFYWIGGDGGEMNDLYHSPHVNWLGDQEQVLDLMNHFDVLFFPSQSDTFGLVLMEALYKGKRVVSYKENGLASYINKLSGCRVFDVFDEDTVLRDIAAVLKEPVNIGRNKQLAHDLCDIQNFETKLTSFYNEA